MEERSDSISEAYVQRSLSGMFAPSLQAYWQIGARAVRRINQILQLIKGEINIHEESADPAYEVINMIHFSNR